MVADSILRVICLTVFFSGKQGGSQPDGGYAEVGPKEEAKCRKSSSLSLLPGAFLQAFIFLAAFKVIFREL